MVHKQPFFYDAHLTTTEFTAILLVMMKQAQFSGTCAAAVFVPFVDGG